jgi:hypothetical protein
MSRALEAVHASHRHLGSYQAVADHAARVRGSAGRHFRARLHAQEVQALPPQTTLTAAPRTRRPHRASRKPRGAIDPETATAGTGQPGQSAAAQDRREPAGARMPPLSSREAGCGVGCPQGGEAAEGTVSLRSAARKMAARSRGGTASSRLAPAYPRLPKSTSSRAPRSRALRELRPARLAVPARTSQPGGGPAPAARSTRWRTPRMRCRRLRNGLRWAGRTPLRGKPGSAYRAR